MFDDRVLPKPRSIPILLSSHATRRRPLASPRVIASPSDNLMTRTLAAAACISAACTLLAAGAIAQAGGAASSGPRITVKVYASVSDSSTAFQPVPGLRVLAIGSRSDTMIAITDATGAATIDLPFDTYRFVSATPVAWRGHTYAWDVATPVNWGRNIVQLSRGNARVDDKGAAARAVELRAATARPSIEPPAPQAARQAFKSEGTAIGLSAVVPGGGQIYAGQKAKGFALLGGSAAAIAIGAATSHTTCDLIQCVRNRTPLYVGIGVAAIAWGYSLVDAPHAVRQYNERLSLGAARLRVSPTLELVARGAPALGLRAEIAR